MKTPTRRALLALTASIALVASACGGGDGDTTEGDTEEPTATEESTATEEPSATEEPTEGDTAAPTGEGELLIWADEQRTEALGDITPAFTEATGVEVTVELVPFDDMREQVSQAAPAGEGPDIFVGAHDWTGELAANGIISPIDLGAKADQFDPVAVNAFGFEGDAYAVPYVTESIILYYNTDIVGDEPPASFDEIAQFCTDEGIEQCLGIPGGGGAADAYHNYPFISAFGGSIFAYDESTGSYDPGTVRLDEDVTVQGAEYLASQVDAGVVEDTDYDTAKNLFLEGTTPFWITGPWELSALDEAGLNYGAAVIPQIGDQPTEAFVGAQGFFLNAFSENQLIAETFLLDFVATDETMQALYDADPRGTAWVAVADGLAEDDKVRVVTEAVSQGIPMPNVPEMGAVWGPLGDNLLQVRSGETDGAPAMNDAAEAVRTAVSGG